MPVPNALGRRTKKYLKSIGQSCKAPSIQGSLKVYYVANCEFNALTFILSETLSSSSVSFIDIGNLIHKEIQHT